MGVLFWFCASDYDEGIKELEEKYDAAAEFADKKYKEITDPYVKAYEDWTDDIAKQRDEYLESINKANDDLYNSTIGALPELPEVSLPAVEFPDFGTSFGGYFSGDEDKGDRDKKQGGGIEAEYDDDWTTPGQSPRGDGPGENAPLLGAGSGSGGGKGGGKAGSRVTENQRRK